MNVELRQTEQPRAFGFTLLFYISSYDVQSARNNESTADQRDYRARPANLFLAYGNALNLLVCPESG